MTSQYHNTYCPSVEWSLGVTITLYLVVDPFWIMEEVINISYPMKIQPMVFLPSKLLPSIQFPPPKEALLICEPTPPEKNPYGYIARTYPQYKKYSSLTFSPLFGEHTCLRCH